MMQANPNMVRLARESRGFAQKDLAARAGLVQGFISKVENGLLALEGDRLAAVARAVGYPVELLVADEALEAVDALFHRRLRTTPAGELRKAQAKINVLRIQLHRLLEGIALETPHTFPRLDLDELDGDIEEAARLVRRHWRLPMGPVANVTATIEAAGGIVMIQDFGTAKVDAASQWPSGDRPYFFVRPGIGGERQRLNLAHEVAHMVLHSVPAPELEDQAHRFAGALLVPAAEFRPQIGVRLTLARLFELKQYWKVSMQALVMRASALGAITDRQKRSFFQTISARGYRKREPGELPQEQPRIVSAVLDTHLHGHRYTIAELSRVAMVGEQEFRDVYGVRDERGVRGPLRAL